MTIDRIAVDAQVHFGQPCVRGTRIPVFAVLELLRDGKSFDDVIRDAYPDLTQDDIRACLDYASALVREEEVHLASH